MRVHWSRVPASGSRRAALGSAQPGFAQRGEVGITAGVRAQLRVGPDGLGQSPGRLVRPSGAGLGARQAATLGLDTTNDFLTLTISDSQNVHFMTKLMET